MLKDSMDVFFQKMGNIIHIIVTFDAQLLIES